MARPLPSLGKALCLGEFRAIPERCFRGLGGVSFGGYCAVSGKFKRQKDYTVSSGNVFADLGLPNPEEALAKAELAHKITVLIEDRGLTQVQTAKLLGIDQPKVSALIRGRLSGFSLERLMRFLLMLGQDIKITVQACPRSRSQARVHVA